MNMFVRGHMTMAEDWVVQLTGNDELLQEGGDIDIYLDYYTWDWESDVKFFPFTCSRGYNIRVRVKDY